MASWPTFNPNDYGDAPDNARRNRAVQDLYEPGSTFKLVTASAAIEEKVVTPDEIIDISAGNIRFGSRVINDMHRYAPLTLHGRDRQVEQRRRDQGRFEDRRRAHGPLHPPVRIRPPDVARLSGRKPGHRVGAVEVERQRARVGVDGLPGRRHAAADGGGRERDRQRRHAVRAARRARDRQGRRAHHRRAQGRAALDPSRDGGDADPDHGEGGDRRHRQGGEAGQLQRRRKDGHRRQARQRPLFAVAAERVVRRLRAVAAARR